MHNGKSFNFLYIDNDKGILIHVEKFCWYFINQKMYLGIGILSSSTYHKMSATWQATKCTSINNMYMEIKLFQVIGISTEDLDEPL